MISSKSIFRKRSYPDLKDKDKVLSSASSSSSWLALKSVSSLSSYSSSSLSSSWSVKAYIEEGLHDLFTLHRYHDLHIHRCPHLHRWRPILSKFCRIAGIVIIIFILISEGLYWGVLRKVCRIRCPHHSHVSHFNGRQAAQHGFNHLCVDLSVAAC